MNFKKIITGFTVSLITLASVITAMPVSAEGEAAASGETFDDGVLTYEYIDGGLAVTDCEQSTIKLNISETVDGYSVIEIRESAFEACTNLSEVSIPSSVKTIGDAAFKDCVGLMKVDIADGITSIPNAMFANCQTLMDITLPETITSIGYGAFMSCYSLTDIVIPESVVSIDTVAFRDCNCLMNINLPASLTQLGEAVFANTYSLDEITISDGNTSFVVDNNVLYDSAKSYVYASAPQGINGDVIIPDTVTQIGSYAFAGCVNMASVEIPKSVTTIGEGVFSYCSSLTGIVLPEGVTAINSYTFRYCEKLTSIELPSSLESIGMMAFLADTALTDVTLPEKLKTISAGAFLDCTALKAITVPKTVSEIDSYALGFYSSEDGTEAIPVDGFKMSVYSGTAGEDYAKTNSISFETKDKSLNKTAFIIICVGIVLAAAVIAVVIINKGKKKTSPEDGEVEADTQEELEEFEEGYESILGSDDENFTEIENEASDDKNDDAE